MSGRTRSEHACVLLNKHRVCSPSGAARPRMRSDTSHTSPPGREGAVSQIRCLEAGEQARPRDFTDSWEGGRPSRRSPLGATWYRHPSPFPGPWQTSVMEHNALLHRCTLRSPHPSPGQTPRLYWPSAGRQGWSPELHLPSKQTGHLCGLSPSTTQGRHC